MALAWSKAEARKPNVGPQSPLWKVFELNGNSFVKEGKTMFQCRCLIGTPAGQPCGEVVESEKRSLAKLWWHVERDHGFDSKAEFRDFVGDETQLAQLLKHGRERRARKKRKANEVHPEVQLSQRRLCSKIQPGSAAYTKLAESYARNMVAKPHTPAPIPMRPPPELQQFFKDYSMICGASSVWLGAPRETLRSVLRKDEVQQWRLVGSELGAIGVLEGCLHHDGWKDPWQRPWLGGGMCWLHPVSWMPRSIILGVSMLSERHDPDIGTLESSESMRDALIGQWLDNMCQDTPRSSVSVAMRQMPPMAVSDNTNAAVRVASIMDKFPGRCGPHLLYLLIKNIFFVRDAPKHSRPPRPTTTKDLVPDLVGAGEALRAWSKFLEDVQTFKSWRAQGRGGDQHAVPHEDSGADWGSTTKLFGASLRMRADFDEFSRTDAGSTAPALPTEMGWALIELGHRIAQAVDAGMSVLQATNARASQILPVLFGTVKEVRSVCADFHNDISSCGGDGRLPEQTPDVVDSIANACQGELERITEVHIKKPWPTSPPSALAKVFKLSKVNCYHDLLQLAALIAVGPSADFGLHEADLHGNLAVFCAAAWKESGKEPLVRPSHHESVSDSGQAGEKVPGRSKLLAFLGGPQPAPTSCTVSSSHFSRVVEGEVVAFLKRGSYPGAASPLAPVFWWRDIGMELYPTMRSGVRVLLGLSAGNGFLERAFGTCRSMLTPLRKQNNLNLVMLRHNASQLAMPGYTDQMKTDE